MWQRRIDENGVDENDNAIDTIRNDGGDDNGGGSDHASAKAASAETLAAVAAHVCLNARGI